MFFDGWLPLLRTLGTGVLVYAGVVLLLRLSGKRTLSKWNAFDFVVTIALGSVLATAILSKSVPLVDGLAALALLVSLQALLTWLSVRSRTVERLVKTRPTLLLYKGALLHDVLRRERVAETEVLAALRAHGVADAAEVGAVVLETDGDFSVIQTLPDDAHLSTLRGVEGAEPHGASDRR